MKAREWSEVMVYSPDESMLAIGGHDDATYIYKIDGDNYKLIATLDASSSAITAIDWTRDSTVIRTVDQAYAKLYYNVETGRPDPHGESNYADATVW